MAGVTAQGATFTFTPASGIGFRATVVGVSVETPTAEVVNMSGMQTPAGTMLMVPTGDWSGGSVTVDYLHAGTFDPSGYVRTPGVVTLTSAGYSVAKRAVLESASAEARSGEVVRGTLRFALTDYVGT